MPQGHGDSQTPKVATQMGTQIHAENNYRRVVELLQAGAIGTVTRIHHWVGGSFAPGDRPTGCRRCRRINRDLWLSPRALSPLSQVHAPPGRLVDFGGGKLVDMACHHMDLSYSGLQPGFRTIDSKVRRRIRKAAPTAIVNFITPPKATARRFT
jgi:predicted dehydrogenase